MDFTFVCIDTAGIDPAVHGIIEVAAVRGVITADSFEIGEEKFHTYVEPHGDTSVSMRKLNEVNNRLYIHSGEYAMYEVEVYDSLCRFSTYDYKLKVADWWSCDAAKDDRFWNALLDRLDGDAGICGSVRSLCTASLYGIFASCGRVPTVFGKAYLHTQAKGLGIDWARDHVNLLDSAIVGAKVLNALVKMGGMV